MNKLWCRPTVANTERLPDYLLCFCILLRLILSTNFGAFSRKVDFVSGNKQLEQNVLLMFKRKDRQ